MRLTITLLAALTLGGCAAQPAPPSADDSLYQNLGGQAGIGRIVEGMLLNIADDERIVEHFVDADINALVENLIAAMDAEGVPVTAQNRLLQRLAPMRGAIIYR